MSEYWKSTPKYWCKHCSTYVKDTKLERANHESTAKHQSALKRFLRDIHRDHEREEREKERAKREVERLTGTVSSSSAASNFSSRNAPFSGSAAGQSSADRQRQMEQLAGLGVSIPTEFRGDMAMAGEWTVTSSRVIQDDDGDNKEEDKDVPLEARASGVRKREQTEEQKEEEEAMRGLFKRPRKWGRDTKTMPTEEDAELDALLSGATLPLKKEEHEQDVEKGQAGPSETNEEMVTPDKVEKDEDAEREPVKSKMAASSLLEAQVKQEPDPGGVTGQEAEDLGTEAPADSSAIVFKKRKPKNLRQK